MSVFISRASALRLVGILACGPPLLAAGGCHHASGVGVEPSRVERTPIGRTDNERAVRRFPGIDVVSARHGGFYIRILSGLTANGEPLYVIDDNPVTIDPNRGIDWLKLEDIVEIRVLKNPAETTVYGPRGVNGVIVLTTRQAALRRRSR